MPAVAGHLPIRGLMKSKALLLLLIGICLVYPCLGQTGADSPLRLGIIGLDTSHCVAFTRILNDPANEMHVAGARVVAAYPGGSPDIPSSIDRLPKFRQELEEKWQIQIVDSIEALLPLVDAVLLESVDGRPHLDQVRPVFAAGKRVFIDKPLAGSLEDAREIVRLSKESGVPFFSASSLRFFPGVAQLAEGPEKVLAADAFSPASLEPHHPDLYWYGIHGVEILYTLMGPGCKEVTRVFNDDGEVVVGLWNDGRIGTFRGLRTGPHDYGALVIKEKGIHRAPPIDGSLYQGLVKEIVKFFQTGEPPVSPEETLEMFEFMTAAQVSSEQHRTVQLQSLR